MPHSNLQPSLALTELISLQGIFPPRSAIGNGITSGSDEFVATITHFAGNFAPNGTATANGQILPISQNTALFSLLGTNYGGDGKSNFALPDLGGNISVGVGQGPGLTDHAIGERFGTDVFDLAAANMPPSVGGVSQQVDNTQPALAINYCISLYGIFPTSSSLTSAAGSDYVASIVEFAGNFAPNGYAICEGQTMSIAENEVLFNLIGTTYGGDGVTTFNLPDLRGRTIIGAGGAYSVGEVVGSEGATLTNDNLPANMGGSGVPVDNHAPSLAMNYMIALTGIFPSQNAISNAGGSGEAYLGEIICSASNVIPKGFALCAGQLLAINQNQALFAILGTTYGGNGVTTFALPNLLGRDIIGTDGSHDLGTVYGTDTVAFSSADIPALNFHGDDNTNSLYGGDSADTINGQGGDDTLHGNGGTDALIGGQGNDYLDGGSGADNMTGGLGNDIFVVDNTLDQVIENPNEGTDTVESSIKYTLGANVENLTLTGLANVNGTGNGLDNFITGNSVNNVLQGKGGNDKLDGGAGANYLYGGSGDDTYVVDSASDRVSEQTVSGVDDGGNDTVMSSINYTLGAFIENLTLTGLANANGTGNGLNNIITGNSGNNVLQGKAGNDKLDGGAGANYLYGGSGDDTYVVASLSDRVSEQTVSGVDDGGNDTVMSSINYTLGAFIENLALTGLANVNGTGNGLDNLITGNSVNNVLQGKGGNDKLDGGAGANYLYGGSGNDTYVVDSASDRVSEQTVSGVDDGGNDTVMSSIHYTLGAFIENLTLTGLANANGTGNGLNNIITGNSGNNVLTGGAGNDTFVFRSAVTNGLDHLNDFVSGQDHLSFTGTDYGFSAGYHLSVAQFTSNAGGVAVGSGAQFVFNTTTHELYWDSNGTGVGGVTAIVIFNNGATPVISDFLFT